jgi:hypothetical protein
MTKDGLSGFRQPSRDQRQKQTGAEAGRFFLWPFFHGRFFMATGFSAHTFTGPVGQGLTVPECGWAI